MLSAITVSVRLDLSLQGCDPVIGCLVSFYTVPRLVDIFRIDQETHPAGQIPLDRPRRRRDPVRDIILQQKIPECQSLLIIRK